MSVKLDLATFQEVLGIISTLVGLTRQLIATASTDKAEIERLKAEALENLAQIEQLAADNQVANDAMPALKAELEAVIAEASAATPQPPEV